MKNKNLYILIVSSILSVVLSSCMNSGSTLKVVSTSEYSIHSEISGTNYPFDTAYNDNYASQDQMNNGCALKYQDGIYFLGDGIAKFCDTMDEAGRSADFKTIYKMDEKSGEKQAIYRGTRVHNFRISDGKLYFRDFMDASDQTKNKYCCIDLNSLKIPEIKGDIFNTALPVLSFEKAANGYLGITSGKSMGDYSLYYFNEKTKKTSLISENSMFPYYFDDTYLIYKAGENVTIYELNSGKIQNIDTDYCKDINMNHVVRYDDTLILPCAAGNYIYGISTKTSHWVNAGEAVLFDKNNYFMEKNINIPGKNAADISISITRKTKNGEIELAKGKIDQYSLIDEWLYYCEYKDSAVEIKRVKIDGSITENVG